MRYYLFFDTETGGILPDETDLLTFYAAMVDEDLKVVDEIDLKLKPNDRLPVVTAEALDVNKIDIRKHLEDPTTVTYAEGTVSLTSFIKKYLKKTGRYSNIIPSGQNVQFDLDFTWKHLIPRNEWEKMIHYTKVDTKICVDFLKDCSWFPKDLSSSLGSVVDYLGLPKRDAHNAKEDTLMTVDVYRKLLEIMKAKKDNAAQQDLISLLEAE